MDQTNLALVLVQTSFHRDPFLPHKKLPVGRLVLLYLRFVLRHLVLLRLKIDAQLCWRTAGIAQMCRFTRAWIMMTELIKPNDYVSPVLSIDWQKAYRSQNPVIVLG
jgi:hypothetical protein